MNIEVSDAVEIVPPRSQVGAITADQRKQIISSSVLAGHYEKAVDRESVYEKLQARAGEKVQTSGAPPVAASTPAMEETKPSLLTEALGTVTAAFQPTTVRAARFIIRLPRRLRRVRCVQPAVRLDDKWFAEFLEGFSAAAHGEGNCSGVCAKCGGPFVSL